MSLIKQILGSLVAATAVTIACQFLPVINSLIGNYLPGVFLAALALPFITRKFWATHTKAGRRSEPELHRRKKECEEWWSESSKATSCPSNCYDLRNIDRQLHMFDGFDDD